MDGGEINVNFSEFAHKLKDIIGGGKKDYEFTRELFENILIIPDDVPDEENPMIKVTDRALKSYFSGGSAGRGLSRFAGKIRKFVEREPFVSYIDSQSPEAQSDIYHEFAAYCPGMNDTNIPESMADLFKRIIVEGSHKKSNINLGNRTTLVKVDELVIDNALSPVKCKATPVVYSVVNESDFSLLSECGMKCSCCGRKVISTKGGRPIGRYVITSIMPIGLDAVDREPYEKLRKPPADLTSLDNRILLCRNCAEDYAYDPTPAKYADLMDIKAIQVNGARISASVYDIEVEHGINDILDALSVMKTMPPRINKTKWKAFRVDKKIVKEIMLQDSVTDHVLKYYRYIEAQFKQREREGSLKFKKVKNEVSECFETIYDPGKTHQEMYDYMVEWLKDKTGCRNITSCSVMISFFVQNCEVFYEVTE